MRSSQVEIGTFVWCRLFGKFGTVVEKKHFMCLVSFNSLGDIWIHPAELDNPDTDALRVDCVKI